MTPAGASDAHPAPPGVDGPILARYRQLTAAGTLTVDAAYVERQLAAIARDNDLSKFIL